MLNALRLWLARLLCPRPYHVQRGGGGRKRAVTLPVDVPEHVMLPHNPGEFWVTGFTPPPPTGPDDPAQHLGPPDDPPDNP